MSSCAHDDNSTLSFKAVAKSILISELFFKRMSIAVPFLEIFVFRVSALAGLLGLVGVGRLGERLF